MTLFLTIGPYLAMALCGALILGLSLGFGALARKVERLEGKR